MIQRVFLAWLLAGLTLLLTPSVIAQTRVVVAELDGDKDERMRRAVVRGLKEQSSIRVIALQHTRSVGETLGATLADAKGVRTLSSALGLGAVVDGSVAEAGGVVTVTLRLRSAKDGEVSETHKFRDSDRATLADKVSGSVWKALGSGLKAAPAPKKTDRKRVVVLPFTGNQAGTVRGFASTALNKRKGVTIIADKQLQSVDIPTEPKAEDLVAAAAALDAALFVSGKVSAAKGRSTLELIAYNGADGQELSEVSVSGKGLAGLRGSINKELVTKLASAVDRSASPEPPEETLSAETDSEATDSEEEAATEEEEDEDVDAPRDPSARPSPLEVLAGVRAFSRNYRYSDDLFRSLRSYKLGAAPAAFIGVRWYPVAHFSGGAASHVGLVGGYERGFALKSQVEGGEELTTKMQQWYAGLRYRIPLGRHEVGAEGSYGRHTFQIEDDPAAPLVPDVDYGFMRLGLDARVRVDRVLLGAHFGYRYLLGTGELGSDAWFPGASGGAVDAGLFAGYEFVTGIALVAGFDFRRYFFSLNPEPGDTFVAGGAVDEYLSGWGGFAFRIPGDAD